MSENLQDLLESGFSGYIPTCETSDLESEPTSSFHDAQHQIAKCFNFDLNPVVPLQRETESYDEIKEFLRWNSDTDLETTAAQTDTDSIDVFCETKDQSNPVPNLPATLKTSVQTLMHGFENIIPDIGLTESLNHATSEEAAASEVTNYPGHNGIDLSWLSTACDVSTAPFDPLFFFPFGAPNIQPQNQQQSEQARGTTGSVSMAMIVPQLLLSTTQEVMPRRSATADGDLVARNTRSRLASPPPQQPLFSPYKRAGSTPATHARASKLGDRTTKQKTGNSAAKQPPATAVAAAVAANVRRTQSAITATGAPRAQLGGAAVALQDLKRQQEWFRARVREQTETEALRRAERARGGVVASLMRLAAAAAAAAATCSETTCSEVARAGK
ncbi:hypothetical protein HDU83_004338 [Entophlyctis luteolus]|nr:hypothetical protein HDU83_004338 [Entophlyctis luteolus]KAJ3394748.1 hypothetical protein HDU84_006891 [Entophlyctis sp. JEL0112]